MIRLYFNLTNKCNTACPFCCMYSGPEKNTFLTFETFQNIVHGHKESFELQVEGGEPFLHPNFYLFLEYAAYTGRCKKIILSTNGILLGRQLDRLIAFQAHNNIPLVVKRSINYHLIALNPKLLKECRDQYLATEFVPGFELKFNVRTRVEDIGPVSGKNNIIQALRDYKIYEQSMIYSFNRYGRYQDERAYPLPTICQNVGDWFIYACDGTAFNKDLVARSEYEKTLC